MELYPKLYDWHINDEENASDHKYIQHNIFTEEIKN